MHIRQLVLLFCSTLMLLAPSVANAHTWYSKALKEKYDFRGVSCQACHLTRQQAMDQLDDIEFDRYLVKPKRYYNDFGKQFVTSFAGKDMTVRYEKAREARRSAYRVSPAQAELWREKAQNIEDEAVQIFLQTLLKVEKVRDPTSGQSYGDLLKAGKLFGIHFRTEPRKMPSDY